MPTPVQKLLSDADMIMSGKHPDPLLDWRDAAQLYTSAGDFGAGEGWAKLAKLYQGPKKYFKRDDNKALALYKKAISLGYRQAVLDISRLYEEIGEIDNALKVWKIFFDDPDSSRIPGAGAMVSIYLEMCASHDRLNMIDPRALQGELQKMAQESHRFMIDLATLRL